MSEKLFNAHLAHRLDVPERVIWLPPLDVIAALDVRSGETIADIGAGTGYFSLPLAKKVGDRGKVYAIDSQQKMLDILLGKVSDLAFQIEPVYADADSTGLPSARCDLVFFANVWHEFSDRNAVLREARRILRKNGRIAILDWRPDVEPEHGPPLAHRLSAEASAEELLSAGFEHPFQQNIGKYSWLVQGALG